ncbi:MAG: DUF3570 domain-containing protein [Granulosicoccaceae bacterium]
MTTHTKRPEIALALGTAAATLLSGPAQAGLLDYDLGGDDWDAEAAFMLYSESDGRVAAIAPAVQATKTIDTDETLTLRFTLDSLTGASPNGAVPSNNAQTFTGPSGGGAYTVAAGEAPLDDTFKDTRAAFNAGWTRPLGEAYTLSVGGNLSKEYDYLSLGASTSVARDFNQKNTTLSAGLALASDTIEAVGGTPVAFDAMPLPSRDDDDDDDIVATTRDGDGGPKGDESKTVTDALFGLTQVIDRDSVLQLSLGFSQSDGYQNDPYKVISVVDANGDPVVADTASNLSLAVYENRPDSRSRQTFYAQYKRNFDGRVLNTSYRYMQDDWEVSSHTLDLSFKVPVGEGWIQPRFRYYTQEAAEFYTPFFREGEQPVSGDTSTYASSDYRLGNMDATTVGLSYGRDGERPWHLTMEYYLQSPEEPDNKFGALEDLDLVPDMSAAVLRLNIDL